MENTDKTWVSWETFPSIFQCPRPTLPHTHWLYYRWQKAGILPKYLIHDCIYFLQHSCIFLQIICFISNCRPPPLLPPYFLQLFFSTRFRACYLLRTYILPFGLYKRSYQPAIPAHPTTLPACPTRTSHPPLNWASPPNPAPPCPPLHPHRAHAGPPPPTLKKIVGSGSTGLLMCAMRMA